MKAVALLSGGLDSTVLASYLKAVGYDVEALTILYGQRHAREVEAAAAVAANLGVPHRVVELPVGQLLRSTLTGHGEVPAGTYKEAIASTVVPARNAILLSVAYGYAVSIGADLVAYAAHATDGPHYPDTTPEFVAKMSAALQEGTGTKVRIEAPFVCLQKHQIVKLGAALGAPLEITWSCYRGGDKHCGVCPTCVERKKAFQLAGVSDPTVWEV